MIVIDLGNVPGSMFRLTSWENMLKCFLDTSVNPVRIIPPELIFSSFMVPGTVFLGKMTKEPSFQKMPRFWPGSSVPVLLITKQKLLESDLILTESDSHLFFNSPMVSESWATNLIGSNKINKKKYLIGSLF